MPAKSKAQQSAAGIALAAKNGKISPKKLKGAARNMYDNMTIKELEDYAKTDSKDLPYKVKSESYKVDADTEVILNGSKYLLEAGDTIVIEQNESDVSNVSKMAKEYANVGGGLSPEEEERIKEFIEKRKGKYSSDWKNKLHNILKDALKIKMITDMSIAEIKELFDILAAREKENVK